MASLRARFHFRVRGLLVEPGLLGTRHAIARDGRTATVIFPVRDADLDAEALAEAELLKPDLFPTDDPPPTPARASIGSIELTPSGEIARIDVVRVEVVTDSTVSAAHFGGSGGKESPRFGEVYELLRELNELARSTLRDLLEWARVRGRQHWLGVGGEAPAGLGNAELVDLDANQVLPVKLGLRPDLVIRRVRDEQVLSEKRLEKLLRRLSESPRPQLEDTLLADAAYYAIDAAPQDPPRALLIAAIACEAKVKQTLREIVHPEGRALLELLLSNPRDYSLAAVALFDQAAKAVCGRSLKAEDRPLYKRVVKLFELRNALVHKREVPSDDDALDSVRAARQVFRWLNALAKDSTPTAA
jgi:hypothetical protein